MRRIACVLVVSLLLMACTPKPAPEPVAPVAEVKVEPCPVPERTVCAPIVYDAIQINEETAGYSISIEYPVLCDPDASRTIRDHVTRLLSDFKKDFPGNDLRDYPVKHDMHITYAVWPAARERLASVKLGVSVFTGGAHPNHWPVTWIFDMADGETLGLDDVFINRKDALIEIAPMVRKVLIASLGDMYAADMLADGTTPVAGNYDDFILNDEGVVFFFAPYQVAPYAAGEQVVTIPYARLAKFMKPEFKAMLR